MADYDRQRREKIAMQLPFAVSSPGTAHLTYKGVAVSKLTMILTTALDVTPTLLPEEPAKKKIMKRLTCRKCEGHGFTSLLKGHAAVCPFNECNCERCTSVMSMRASALIRRFRHRQPGHSSAVLKTIRSKNGNMRLRIVPKKDHVEDGTTITYTDETSARAYVVSSAMCSTASGSPSPSLPTTPPCLPSSFNPTTTPPLPHINHDLLAEYVQQILQARLLTELLKQQANFAEATESALLPPMIANAFSTFQPLQQFFSVV